MSRYNQSGFTIIESMLFLAISGTLTVGILAGSGFAINQQRYRDSVNTLRSELQQQFSDVANVHNSRGTNWTCDTSALLEEKSDGTEQARGASDCIFLGRYIKSFGSSKYGDGTSLQTYSVIAHKKPDPLPVANPTTDTDAIKNYNLELSSIDAQDKQLEWDASIRQPDVAAGNQQALSILIVRSTLNGAIRTYVQAGSEIDDNNIASLVADANLSKSLKMCVDMAGFNFAGGTLAVILSANASNQSAVETLSEGSGC